MRSKFHFFGQKVVNSFRSISKFKLSSFVVSASAFAVHGSDISINPSFLSNEPKKQSYVSDTKIETKKSKKTYSFEDLTTTKIARMIDHTALKPTTTLRDIKKLCNEAIKYNFASVCVSPYWVSTCYDILKENNKLDDIKVCTVVGFPLGHNSTYVKLIETAEAILSGASEIDMVLNISAYKSLNYEYIEKEFKSMVKLANILHFYKQTNNEHLYDIGFINDIVFKILEDTMNIEPIKVESDSNPIIIKVILETCLLNDNEIKHVSKLCIDSGVDFIKTSTGFSTGGATLHDVKLIRDTIDNYINKDVNPNIGIKASGGIRNLASATDMINSGATRIGASSSVNIVDSKNSTKTSSNY